MPTSSHSLTCSWSAPGSTMVCGEHSVVYGHAAMVCAVEQRITVSLQQRTDRKVVITSSLANTELHLDNIKVSGALRFVLACIEHYQSVLPSGFNLTIVSQINPTLGLGSSAAVCVATLGCLRELAQETTDINAFPQLHSDALHIVKSIQGRGSGADLAASLYGGLIAYYPPTDNAFARITPLPAPASLLLAYCGYKTPTGEVLARLADAMRGQESLFQQRYTDMGHCTQQAITAASQSDWPSLATQLNQYQQLMQQLGVSDDKLNQLVSIAKTTPGCLAAKISGSGLGDCVLALSEQSPEQAAISFASSDFSPVEQAQQGLIKHD